MSTLWALLVGIDNYPIEPINGALADVDKVYNYLVYERGVRPECIQVLRDEEATRASIIAAFQRHLIDNRAIQPHSPMLFHFSGHGTRELPPEGYEREREDEEDDGAVECIVPFDSVCDSEENPGAAPPLPDYTLGALLRRAAGRNGNNITVTFDCCHAADGTRSRQRPARVGWTRRRIDSRFVGRLERETDREIWGEERRGVSFAVAPWRGGIRGREDSHVLMAACNRWEEAIGSEQGGLFTGLWLEALRESNGMSYLQIKELILKKFDALYQKYEHLPPDQQPDVQHPQVEGVGCDRPVFESAGDDLRQRFAVQQGPDPTECIIFAGMFAGVKPGTIFQLQRVGQNIPGTDDATLLGTAVATEVQAAQCVAKVAKGVAPSQPAEGVRALLMQVAEPLRVFLNRDMLAGSTLEDELREALRAVAPQEGMWFELVNDEARADLVLEVDDTRVALTRRTPHLAGLGTMPPRVRAADVRRVFPGAMRHIARFNFYLALASQAGPFARDVDVRLHYLKEYEPTYSDEEYMELGDEIPLTNEEATVLHEEDTVYALALHNRGPHALYVYVLFFDPASYAVQFFYESSARQPPPLRPGMRLQLGRSPECPDAIYFIVDDDQPRDTGFLKVILTVEPMDLKFMEQPACIGYDRESGELKHASARGGGPSGGIPQPVKGTWDVQSIKITVLSKV